jgi:pimeloyl-ACP methyl ester carboxylesterase
VSEVTRGFAPTAEGVIHYAAAGEGSAVLLLHQTPRSWDEYRDVLPLLGRRHRAIAMDTLGFGDSEKPSGPDSVERWARAAVGLLDALAIERAAVVGHHTGSVIAIELAASYPERVERLVLSGTPLVTPEGLRERARRPAVDEVEPSDDGSHLTELWRQRMAFYPPGRPDLLTRFVIDALRAGDRAARGHHTVWEYEMERKLELVRAPALVVVGTDDPFALPHARPLSERLSDSRVLEIPGGMVPLPDQLPREFADAVLAFLAETSVSDH